MIDFAMEPPFDIKPSWDVPDLLSAMWLQF